MKIFTKTIILTSKNELEFIKITSNINRIIDKANIKEGFVNIFSRHTTLAIEINEDEVLLIKDMNWLLKKLTPEKSKYYHDNIKLRKYCPHDEPKNAKGHLRSMLLETSETIPIKGHKMQLGAYQQIFAIETSGPRQREIIIQIFGK